jgi:hypothetical protein
MEDALNRVDRGWLEVPEGTDLPAFLLAGGVVPARPICAQPTTASAATTPGKPDRLNGRVNQMGPDQVMEVIMTGIKLTD